MDKDSIKINIKLGQNEWEVGVSLKEKNFVEGWEELQQLVQRELFVKIINEYRNNEQKTS